MGSALPSINQTYNGIEIKLEKENEQLKQYKSDL